MWGWTCTCRGINCNSGITRNRTELTMIHVRNFYNWSNLTESLIQFWIVGMLYKRRNKKIEYLSFIILINNSSCCKCNLHFLMIKGSDLDQKRFQTLRFSFKLSAKSSSKRFVSNIFFDVSLWTNTRFFVKNYWISIMELNILLLTRYKLNLLNQFNYWHYTNRGAKTFSRLSANIISSLDTIWNRKCANMWIT